MLNIKKIAAMLCTIALAATTFVLPVSAKTPTLSFGLADGKTAPSGSSKGGYFTNLMVECPGLTVDENEYYLTSAMQLEFYVTKGVFTAASVTTLASGADGGLYGLNGGGAPSTTANIVPGGAEDEYDVLKMGIYGSDAYTTDGNGVWEVKLKYAVKADFPDAVFIPKADSSYVKICDESTTVLETVSAFSDVDYTYTVGGYENTVTKAAIGAGGGEEDDNTVAFEGFTGTKENGEADGSVSVATKKTFSGAAGANKILWTVNLKEGGKGTYESTVNLDGEADYTLGMIINGLAKELVASIEAVLAQ